MLLRHRLHQFGWLVLINSLFSILITINVVNTNPVDYHGLTLFYASISTWSHMALLTALVSIVAMPIILLRSNKVRFFCFALFYALFFVALIANSLCFELYKFHINGVIVDMLLAGQVIEFSPIAWAQAIVIFIVIFVFQFYLATWLSKPRTVMKLRLGRKFTSVTVIALLASNTMHAWASATVYQPITGFSKYLPFFKPATANSFMRKYGLVDEEALAQQKSMSLTQGQFNYPLQPIEVEPVEKPLDIVFVVLDSWRYDAFTAQVTPNIWRFSQQGVVFNQHFSTGNSTRTGISGLFYGLPGTAWQDIYNNRVTPLLMDRMRDLGYQFGIFSSAQLVRPEFNETVFARIEGLKTHTKGDDVLARDKQVTKNWSSWYTKRDPNKPSFSFIFYDAIHGYAVPEGYHAGFEPMHGPINHMLLDNNYDREPILNRYLTSTHFVDSLAASVLEQLDIENTLVIITSDHGEELNDNKLNYWGHNSNFTEPQIKVPFVVVGPKSEKWQHWQASDVVTSHLDVVPTLMNEYLGVKSTPKDYSAGYNLTGPVKQRNWLLLSSYNKYAVVSKQQIIEVSPMGTYELLDPANKPSEQEPNFEYIQEAMQQISHFQ
ncbi:DUF3413 domain-containing protein [Pseudoalteromonas galatheae]|uniref:DUF3413 domain-containing protein n=1 Tax=Pseudoalteromonas galatheae TaxID=579562 RepID=UPI0030D58FF4